MNRRAPATGYDFGSKRNYRRAVWGAFRQGIHGPMADAHALLMPSAEGDEVEQALASGFEERNLHVVDFNPAIVASLKRRFGKINTYGVSAARACARIKSSGVQLAAANFDFTGNLPGIAREVILIGGHNPFAERARVAFTMLRGREPRGWEFLGESGPPGSQATENDRRGASELAACGHGEGCDFTQRDVVRYVVTRNLFGAISNEIAKDAIEQWGAGGSVPDEVEAFMRISTLCRAGIYRSGTQTMLWLLLDTMTALWVKRMCDAAARGGRNTVTAARSVKRRWESQMARYIGNPLATDEEMRAWAHSQCQWSTSIFDAVTTPPP